MQYPFTIPPTPPNQTIDGDGFYVSYNQGGERVYGCDTTALVLGQMEKFYILKGDHRPEYSKVIAQGFEACLAHYKANIALSHRFSSPLPT